MHPKFSLALSFLILFVTANIFAGEPAVHTSPTPVWVTVSKPYTKRIPAREVKNGFFYQFVEEQIHIEKQAFFCHDVREIVSEAGIQNGSEISVNFDPSYERLDFHQVTVWRNNKPIDQLKPGAFKIIADETELSRFIYQGSYSAYMILSDIRKGDRIEYAYTITGRNPIFGNKFMFDLYLQTGTPVAHLYKSIISSSSRKLNFKIFNNAPAAKFSQKNGLNSYEWESFQLKPVEGSGQVPSWHDRWMHIQISDYSNWKEVTDWALRTNPSTSIPRGELATEIARLKKDSHDDKSRYLRSAVTMVQDEVRNMGIELGVYSHRANRPERVYAQRYGDCKDKSLLLATVLKAGGIPAYLVLINTDLSTTIDNYLPSPAVFDHVVVLAVVNGKNVWIDPTMSYQRGSGTDLYFPDYRRGLIVKEGNSALTAIPASNEGTTNCVETYTISDDAKAMLLVETTYKGSRADNMRNQLASSGLTDLEKDYLDYYKGIFPKAASTDTVTVIDNEKLNILTVIEHYKIPEFLKTDSTSGRLNGNMYANFINSLIPGLKADTSNPLSISRAIYNYTAKLVLHGGWEQDLDEKEIKGEGYAFNRWFSTNQDTLILNYRLSMLNDVIPVSRVNEFKETMQKISDDELGYNFTYTPGSVAQSFRLNYWMLLALLIFAAGFTFLAIRIYRTETPPILMEKLASFTPIGGWLVLVCIGLFLSCIRLPYELLTTGYLNLNAWNRGSALSPDIAYKCVLVFEALYSCCIFGLVVFCLVLMFNRRDILPKYIIILYICNVGFALIDTLLIWTFSITPISFEVIKVLVQTGLVAAIWIPYFRVSTRVKETFIVPYPRANIHYEDEDAAILETGQSTE